MVTDMITDAILLFESLLKTAEIKKVDFKGSQYRLDTDILKSEFVKDILCMANAPGGDGYIVLGVSAQGEQREVVGISTHHDGASLEELVASVIEEPIHFEYFPVVYKGTSCALLHIPSSSARPHWPKKDFGKLRKHVLYTRRSSGNREASLSEIREMFLSSIRITDISRRRTKLPPQLLDELAEFDLPQRIQVMYEMLKSIVSKVSLGKYSLISHEKYGWSISKTFALVSNVGTGVASEYAVFMYPIAVRKDNIISSRSSVVRTLDAYRYYLEIKDKPKNRGWVVNGHVSYTYNQTKYKEGKIVSPIGKRLRDYSYNLVHISYQNIYTRFTGLEWGTGGLQNSWDEPWGKIVKWKTFITDKSFYEFFIPTVASRADLLDRLSNLVSWVNTHPL